MPMTADEMEALLRNLDQRTSRIEQILPTLATKDDLRPFATRDDLRNFATKDDLKALAATMATKDELRALAATVATKDELQELRRHMLVLHEDVKADIRMLAEAIAGLTSGGHAPS